VVLHKTDFVQPWGRGCCVAAAAAVGGRDVDDEVTATPGVDCAGGTVACADASACCFNSRSRFTCVTMLMICRDIVLTSVSSTKPDFT